MGLSETAGNFGWQRKSGERNMRECEITAGLSRAEGKCTSVTCHVDFFPYIYHVRSNKEPSFPVNRFDLALLTLGLFN